MKQILVLLFSIFLFFSIKAQEKYSLLNLLSKEVTVNISNQTTSGDFNDEENFRVNYLSKQPSSTTFIIDGKYEGKHVVINDEVLEQVKINKENSTVLIKTKDSYSPDIKTLAELRNEKIKDLHNDYIFMIDNNHIRNKPNEVLIDINYILKITVETLDTEHNGKPSQPINAIHIYTRTPENIEAVKQIRIR